MIHARNDYQERIQDSANKIPADEPVFLLRAQDITSPSVIREWVRLNKKLLKEDVAKKGATMSKEELHKRKRAIALAEAHAFRMDDWPKKKAADV